MTTKKQPGLLHEEYKSSIPTSAEARQINDYRDETSADGMSGAIWTRNVQYFVEDKLVGQRCYGNDGLLWSESGLNEHGQMHGFHYEFEEFDEGHLQCKEYYDKGRLHGTAKQWSSGKFVGDYSLEYGTGTALWRGADEEGNIVLWEIEQREDGLPHGYFWWPQDDQTKVSMEEHWHEGERHGIVRLWNQHDRLARGYPQYYVYGEKVDKRKYLRRAAKDNSLPPFRLEEQSPQRSFTPAIQKVIREDRKRSKGLKS